MTDDKNIIRYLDGEMTEDERLEFEKKISRNPDLAKEVEAIRNIQKLAGKAMRQAEDPEDSLDPETREEIRQAVIDFKEGGKDDLPAEVDETIKRNTIPTAININIISNIIRRTIISRIRLIPISYTGTAVKSHNPPIFS